MWPDLSPLREAITPKLWIFCADASRKGCTGRALQLLATLSEKDLRDTPSAVLADHLYNTDKNADAATVLAPRVADEMLTPYRSFLQRENSGRRCRRVPP